MSDLSKQSADDGKLQGEGDYAAARRYRDGVTRFVDAADVEKLAKDPQPLSAKEARDLAMAEESARTRSKGDDPADLGIMYKSQHEKGRNG